MLTVTPWSSYYQTQTGIIFLWIEGWCECPNT